MSANDFVMKLNANTLEDISVLLVDDHAFVLRAVERILDGVSNITVLDAVVSVDEALRVMEHKIPAVMLLDLSLKRDDGFKLIDIVYARHRSTKILVYSMHSEYLFAERCIRRGARGYLRKGCASDVLIEAIHHVAGGGIYISDIIQQEILGRIRGVETSYSMIAPLQGLTDRELEVFYLVGQGYETREIAERTGLNSKTIQTHQSRIRTKMDVHGQEDLQSKATELLLANMTE